MSIPVTIRPRGATSGGEDTIIPESTDLNNPNPDLHGTIDRQDEFEAALRLIGTSDNVVIVRDRGEIFDRARLEGLLQSIRNGRGATTAGTGPSHGIGLDGHGFVGIGDQGHDGGGGRLTYTLSVPVLTGNHRLFFDASLGAGVGHYNRDYTTVGGEAANSAFTNYGGRLGAALRYAPPILNHRLWASLGLGFGVFGFGTAESTTVSTPGDCMPGDFGRPDCEPTAGPRMGNAGTTGLLNPNLGGSRGTSGLGISVDIPLTIGVDILRTGIGTGSLYGVVAPQYTSLMPADGNGFAHWGIAVGGGFLFRIGGSAVEQAQSATETPRTETVTLSEQPPVGEVWNLDPVLQAQLPAGAQIRSVAFDGNNLSGPPYSVPAASMTAGRHTLRVTYRMPGETEDRVRELTVTVAAPVTPPPGDGFVGIEHNETIERP